MELRKINDVVVNPPPLPVLLVESMKKPVNPIYDEAFPNIFIVGRKESGKTNLILNILRNIVDPKTIIVLFCSTHDTSTMWKFIKQEFASQIAAFTSIVEHDIKTKKDINNLDAFIARMKKPKRNLEDNNYIVIFDDISDETRNKSLKKLFKENRHYKTTTIASSQSAKDLLPGCISQLGICLMLDGIDDDNVEHLRSHMGLWFRPKDFIRAYKVATAKKYDFLYVDRAANKLRQNFNTQISIPEPPKPKPLIEHAKLESIKEDQDWSDAEDESE